MNLPEKKIIYNVIKHALDNTQETEAVSTSLKLTQSDLYYLSSLIENDMKWNVTKEATPFDKPKRKWINQQGGFWGVAECSICHEKYPLGCVKPNYCPNCGREME